MGMRQSDELFVKVCTGYVVFQGFKVGVKQNLEFCFDNE